MADSEYNTGFRTAPYMLLARLIEADFRLDAGLSEARPVEGITVKSLPCQQRAPDTEEAHQEGQKDEEACQLQRYSSTSKCTEDANTVCDTTSAVLTRLSSCSFQPALLPKATYETNSTNQWDP